MAPESLHLTLRFLGHVEAPVLDGLIAAARGLRFDPFELRLGAQGAFGAGRRVRVVWLAIGTGEGPLAALASRLEAAAREAGLPPEDRPFRAHLTLARAPRQGASLPALPSPPETPAWTVAEFELYKSRLTPAGPIYSPVERFYA